MTNGTSQVDVRIRCPGCQSTVFRDLWFSDDGFLQLNCVCCEMISNLIYPDDIDGETGEPYPCGYYPDDEEEDE
jgi:hypothetical protein